MIFIERCFNVSYYIKGSVFIISVMRMKCTLKILEICTPVKFARHFNGKSSNIKKDRKEISEVLIIGDNTWTALGIAQLSVLNGDKVTFCNPTSDDYQRNQNSLKLKEDIRQAAQKLRKTYSKQQLSKEMKILNDPLSRLEFAVSPHTALKTADIVIESSFLRGRTFEKFNFKRKLLNHWFMHSPSESIFVFVPPDEEPSILDRIITLLGNEFSKVALSERQHNVLCINFLRPIMIMKTCEVFEPVQRTSHDSMENTLSWLERMNISPVLVNRSGDLMDNLTMLKEFMPMVENGSANICDIDRMAKKGLSKYYISRILRKVSSKSAGFVPEPIISNVNVSRAQMGPFEMADFIGLDKTKLLLDEMHHKNIDARPWQYLGETERVIQYEGMDSQLLSKLIAEGKLGRKVGEGFYCYKSI